MSDVSLVPVDHQPDFEDVSLVPVDHDPFSEDGVTSQAQSQQAQSQPAQPQQPAAGVERLYVSPPAKNPQASEVGESWDPDAENNDTAGLAASTPAQDKPNYDWSRFNQPLGELKPATFTPTQQIGYLAADALMAAGMQPYDANHLTNGIGGLLGLTPLGVVGSALDLVDASHRGDLPGALIAAAGMIPPAKGVGRVIAEEAGAGLRALRKAVPRAPSSRALRRALKAAGQTRQSGDAAHHIVAKKALVADPARITLQRLGIGIDDAPNGVFLQDAQHKRLHSNKYYEAVNKSLAGAASKAEAEQILESI